MSIGGEQTGEVCKMGVIFCVDLVKCKADGRMRKEEAVGGCEFMRIRRLKR